MKKLILLILLIVSIKCYSQTFETDSNVMGTWNELTKKWEYEDKNYSNITFTFENGVFSADDKAHSEYRIYDKGENENDNLLRKLSFRNVLDDKGRKCYLMFHTRIKDNTQTIMIMYSDIVFTYFIKSSLSKF